MPKPSVPTGRPKRFRIHLVCHTGIDPIRQFWELFSGLRRSLRQEYLRRCLLLGYRFGRTGESGWPEPDPDGKVRKVEIQILGDDPDLHPFLSKYEAMGMWEARTLWVLKTCLAGHGILSGSVEGIAAPLSEPQDAPGSKTDNRPESAETLLGGLFS
jgi:hypothetical protein